MNKELEKYLLDSFPTFFRDMYGDPMKTCMAWGCAHGDGWFTILRGLCENIQDECQKDPETMNFQFEQIKEKFGTLTIYHSGGNSAITKLIAAAERQSESICEQCGSQEQVTTEPLQGGFWILTLCAKCREENTCQTKPKPGTIEMRCTPDTTGPENTGVKPDES